MVQAESIATTLVYTYNANGLRVAQSVDGAVTNFVWDWASGVPEMLSEDQTMVSSIALYLVGHDTLGYWNDGEWTYHLPDALGSIRQITDEAGSVTASREWSPFGVELAPSGAEGVGAGQAGLGYTGEWWDASVGLQYLRARWYDGLTGRFTQVDPWSGNHQQPLTMNPYLCVLANPINFTDPSGLIPHRGEIGDITPWVNSLAATGKMGEFSFQYSCNCGWIDWNHALSGMWRGTSLASTLLSQLGANVNWYEYPNWTGNRGIYLETRSIVGETGSGIAVVPEHTLNQNLSPIAAGIFMEHSEQVENNHPEFLHTHYSEEDLPSNLIGLYMATRMIVDNVPYRDALNEIIELCDVMDAETSTSIFDEYHFIQGWQHWNARFALPSQWRTRLSIPKGWHCNGGGCNARWPSQFSRLARTAVRSSRGGMWWWYDNPYVDGIPVETNTEGVFALLNFFTP